MRFTGARHIQANRARRVAQERLLTIGGKLCLLLVESARGLREGLQRHEHSFICVVYAELQPLT